MINFNVGRLDSAAQTSFNSTRSLSPNTSSFDSSKRTHGAHFSIINDLSPSGTKSMAARTVTDKTAAFTTEIDAKLHAATIETAKIKKKKKKKKPPTVAQETNIAGQLGEFFSLADTSPKQTKERYSLFSKSYCPKFTEEEQKVFVELLKQNAFCENTNLFEVFMADFLEQWSCIIKQAIAYDSELGEQAKEVNEDDEITMKIHSFYFYIIGMENEVTDLDIDEYYNEDLFLNSSDFLVFLKSYIVRLSVFMISVETRHANRNVSKCKNIRELKKNKYNFLCQSLNLLKTKVLILFKCVQSSDVGALFLFTNVINLVETYDPSVNSAAMLAKVKKSYVFLKYFASLSEKNSKTSRDVEICIESIEKAIATKFNKKSSIEFMATYRKLSISILRNQLDFFGYLKSSEDPNYTYAVFCKEQGTALTSNKTQKEFRGLLLRACLNLDIFDKWINDLYQEVSAHFKTEGVKLNIRAPQDHIQRLLSLFNLFSTYTSTSYNDTSEPEIINSFHGKINEKMSVLIAKHELQYKLAFNNVSFNKVSNSLKNLMLISIFRLSHYQFSVLPIIETVQIHGKSFHRLDEIRCNILQLIRDAKQNDELGDWDPNMLKRVIQEMLFRKALPLYMYLMIIEDAKALLNPSRPDDILHLLPNEMVCLLDLTGFDEIFSEKTINEALSCSPLPEVLMENQEEVKFEEETKFQLDQAPPTHGVTKTQTALTTTKVAKKAPSFLKPNILQQERQRSRASLTPEKQDFIQKVKRPMIVKLLKAMNIFYDHTTGSHAVFHHAETSAQVVVPGDTADIGTRLSIFFQALAAQPK